MKLIIGTFEVEVEKSARTAKVIITKEGGNISLVLEVNSHGVIDPLTLLDSDLVKIVQCDYIDYGLQVKDCSTVSGTMTTNGIKCTIPQHLCNVTFGFRWYHNVHHVNGNTLDNRLENLVVLSQEVHGSFHGMCKRKLTPKQIAQKVVEKGFPELIELYGTEEKAERYQPADINTYRKRIVLEFFGSLAAYEDFLQLLMPLL